MLNRFIKLKWNVNSYKTNFFPNQKQAKLMISGLKFNKGDKIIGEFFFF